LLPAAALYGWALYVGAQDLLLLSFALFCAGAGAAMGGQAGLRAVFLPAIFLLLLVPMPATLVNQLIYPLQLANAQASAFVLNDLLGIHATSSGTIVTTELKTFHVIESCAGLRTMATMLMSAIVYADLFQRSRRETAILLLAAPLIGAAINLARVLSLMLNPHGDLAEVHTLQGIVMIVSGILLLAALDSVLARWLPADDAYLRRWAQPADPKETEGHARGLRAILPLCVVASMTLGSFVIQPWHPERMIWWAPYKIPMELDDWQAKSVPVDKHSMGSLVPSHWIRRAYRKGSALVEVYVASDNLQGRHTSLLSGRTVLPGPAFSVREQRFISLDGVEGPVLASVLQAKSEQMLSYRWLIGASGLATETLRAFLAIDRSDFSEPRRLLLVRISTRVDTALGGRLRAKTRLLQFADVLVPWLNQIKEPEAL
jgi:exosortase